MNLFRSEGHARNWRGFKGEAEGGLLTLPQVLAIFSDPMFRVRGASDYLSQYPALRKGFLRTLAQVTRDSAFWAVPPAPQR